MPHLHTPVPNIFQIMLVFLEETAYSAPRIQKWMPRIVPDLRLLVSFLVGDDFRRQPTPFQSACTFLCVRPNLWARRSYVLCCIRS